MPNTHAAITTLQDHFGQRLQTGQAIRHQHGHTTTWIATQPPEAVLWPHTTAEVQKIVQTCAAHGVPIIPFGTGTSLEGQVNAPQGGLCLDMSQMNRILAVHPADMDCTVEPGVTRKMLNEHLRDTGLFFSVDPGADASIGGMASTRASGTNAVRYGTMKDVVLGLKAVLPNGEILQTAQRARKSSAGYDLTRLMIGAEGTLGVITELTLKLYGQPEAISSAICSFPSIQAACNAVIATIQYGLPMARIELLDANSVRAVNAYSKLSLPEAPLLLLEFHGSDASVQEQAEAFGDITADFGASGFEWTTKPEDRTRLWQARHDAYWASVALRPGCKGITTDVCVPISALADCAQTAQDKAAEMGFDSTLVGHVGDGNFHVLLLIDANDPAEIAKAESYIAWQNELALSVQGTCTGEHGIGQGKAKYLEPELGRPALTMMRAIKGAIDPQGIMNPGKIF
jgi:D-lactate dehydrogenase (cytochrome)